jgi:hypothetical protein
MKFIVPPPGRAVAVLYHALSLKQPWAALLAAGLKTVEVRRWRTDYRGPLLIHAARVPDDRPEAWAHVPPELREAAGLGGGLVGVGTLASLKPYRDLDAFVADAGLHLNDPSWFEHQGLFGLCFTDLRPLPFRRVPGYVRIFEVELDGLDLPPAPAAPAAAAAPVFAAVLHRFRRLARALGGKRPPGEGE